MFRDTCGVVNFVKKPQSYMHVVCMDACTYADLNAYFAGPYRNKHICTNCEADTKPRYGIVLRQLGSVLVYLFLQSICFWTAPHVHVHPAV